MSVGTGINCITVNLKAQFCEQMYVFLGFIKVQKFPTSETVNVSDTMFYRRYRNPLQKKKIIIVKIMT